MPYGVLVIEDEATLARNIQTYLEKHGYDARVSGTGEAGLAEFGDFKPDVILLDFNLPGRNGLTVSLRRPRRQGPRSRGPIEQARPTGCREWKRLDPRAG